MKMSRKGSIREARISLAAFRDLQWIFILAEDLRINLGPLTPWIIAGMMGSWPHRVEAANDELDEDVKEEGNG
jgi:hypothetical protein